MDIPALKPQLNANLSDSSKVDDSISQKAVTINATGNATINSNSGNERGKTGTSALFQVLAVSIICDLLVCGMILFNNHEFHTALENANAMSEQRADERHAEVEKKLEWIKKSSSCSIKEAKEGTIWILRRDILNSIEIYTGQGQITAKQYKRLKDQFDYYESIGGNHDVKEKWTDFQSMVLGTGQVKMVN